MATQVQNRRGSTSEHSTFTGAVAEVTVDTDKDTVVVHDGTTAGGRPLLREDQSNLPTSAPTTGIYNNSGALALSTSSSERIRIGPNGEIGLGGANYGTNGQVLTSAGSGAAPTWQTLSVSANSITQGNTTAEVIDTGSDGRFVVTTEGTERLRVDSSGRLGIGTTSPVNALSVAGGISSTTNTNDANTPAAQFDYDGTGARWFAYKNTGSYQIFYTNPSGGSVTERLRIDSAGRLLVGTSSGVAAGSSVQAALQVVDNSNLQAAFRMNRNDSAGPTIAFGKSRSTSDGGFTVLQSNDELGAIRFAGADGGDLQTQGAAIAAFVDGTPGANDMPGRLVFSTTADGASSPTERMRITQNGEIWIGGGSGSTPGLGNTNTGTTFSGTRIYVSNPSNYGLLVNSNANSSVVSFRRSGVQVGTISVTTTNTAYNTSSDYRLKENVTPVTDGITRLQQLKPSRFNFIADPTKTVDGFLAHEVQTIVPEAITGEKDAVDDEGNPLYQGIDQSKIVPLLTAALQEAVAKIESLEARLTAAGI